MLSPLHPLTTMLFFMQDFEIPPVGLARWSHVAVHNTNPASLCKNGEGTGKERKHPIQQFVKSFGISILHSAARDFHQEWAWYDPNSSRTTFALVSHTSLIVHSGRASTSARPITGYRLDESKRLCPPKSSNLLCLSFFFKPTTY